MNEEEIKTTDLWDLYEKSVTFMSLRNIYSDTDRNYRMYNGNQWEGLKVDGVEKIQYNFIKPIIKHKVTTVTSNLFAFASSANTAFDKRIKYVILSNSGRSIF